MKGVIENGVHHFRQQIFYEDTDFSGFVYHANYLKFCERGRSDFLYVLGIDQNAMKEADLMFVVRHMGCEFLRPAVFGDAIIIETTPVEMKGARFQLSQRVLRGEEVLFTADVTVALVDSQGRPKRMGAEMQQKFTVLKP